MSVGLLISISFLVKLAGYGDLATCQLDGTSKKESEREDKKTCTESNSYVTITYFVSNLTEMNIFLL